MPSCSYLHACLAEVQPHGELLPGEDVRVLRPLERPLQLVQLERCERGPGAPHLEHQNHRLPGLPDGVNLRQFFSADFCPHCPLSSTRKRRKLTSSCRLAFSLRSQYAEIVYQRLKREIDYIQRGTKRYVSLAKQDPGKARQRS